jgi:hypothetical protein
MRRKEKLNHVRAMMPVYSEVQTEPTVHGVSAGQLHVSNACRRYRERSCDEPREEQTDTRRTFLSLARTMTAKEPTESMSTREWKE